MVRRGLWLVAARAAGGRGWGDLDGSCGNQGHASRLTCSAPDQDASCAGFSAQKIPILQGEVGARGTNGQWLMTSSRQVLGPHKRVLERCWLFGDDECSSVRFPGPRSVQEREGLFGLRVAQSRKTNMKRPELPRAKPAWRAAQQTWPHRRGCPLVRSVAPSNGPDWAPCHPRWHWHRLAGSLLGLNITQ